MEITGLFELLLLVFQGLLEWQGFLKQQGVYDEIYYIPGRNLTSPSQILANATSNWLILRLNEQRLAKVG